MIRYSHFQIGQTLISVSNLNLGKRTNDFGEGMEFVVFVHLSAGLVHYWRDRQTKEKISKFNLHP